MKFFSIIFSFLILNSCSQNSNHPTEQSNNENQQITYSKSELSDLETAEGREVAFLNQQKFESLIASEELLLFHINEISDAEYFKILEEVESEFEGNFKLIHLFIQNKMTPSEVNLFIRKNNLASEAFILSNISFLKRAVNNWEERVPAIWLTNQREGIDLLYEQKFSKDELMAILQPVTL